MPDYTTPDLVLARLRLPADDQDAGYVASCTATANARVDTWLARTDPADTAWPPLLAPYPDPVVYAATGIAVRLYRGKDAMSDVSESWDSTLPLRVARDPLEGFVAELAPYRHPREWAPV